MEKIKMGMEWEVASALTCRPQGNRSSQACVFVVIPQLPCFLPIRAFSGKDSWVERYLTVLAHTLRSQGDVWVQWLLSVEEGVVGRVEAIHAAQKLEEVSEC